MSGASALASARRRRAGSQPDPQQSNNQRQTQVQTSQNENNEQKYTPLQILQIHSGKINELENNIEDKIENYVNSIIEEKMKNLQTTNTSNNVDHDLINTINKKIEFLESTLTNNLIENKELYKTKLTEESIVNNLNTKIDSIITNKMNTINETIKSILLNIEKFSELSKINETYTQKFDSFIDELNSLKMLVIKNQTLSLENSNEIIKYKDLLKTFELDLEELHKSFENLSVEQKKEDSEDEDNLFSNTSHAQMLLKSMFGEVLNKTSLNDDQNDDSDDDDDNLKKLNIHDSCYDDVDEINLESETVETIKDEVCKTIENTNNENNNTKIIVEDDTIEEISTSQ
jgi:hypothetical protein